MLKFHCLRTAKHNLKLLVRKKRKKHAQNRFSKDFKAINDRNFAFFTHKIVKITY